MEAHERWGSLPVTVADRVTRHNAVTDENTDTNAESVSIGFTVSGSIVPEALAPRYGGRVAPGAGVFLTLRAARM